MLGALRRTLTEVLPSPGPIILCPRCELRIQRCLCSQGPASPARPPLVEALATDSDRRPWRSTRNPMLEALPPPGERADNS